MKKHHSKKRILVIVSCILVLVICAWWAFSVIMYNSFFNKRFESYEPKMFYVQDFSGLQRTKYVFPSDQGQMLTGYLYSTGGEAYGILILAHGIGGGGHNSYMDCINFFAQHGYDVFAYDATASDESEGEGVGGFPQGVVDLDYAVSFVEQSGNFPDLPIGLFGHSWGAYSACSVLTYHPEVKAVIACSGCNQSSDIVEYAGKEMSGSIIYTMMPFIKLHEWVKYGQYATNTAMDGFEASAASVMIVQSADDQVVPPCYGYDLYYDKYQNDPRFRFLLFEDRGHNNIFIAPTDTYADEFNEAFSKWLETLGYDYQAEENEDRFLAEKADYLHQHLDRARWSNRLDEELFAQFVDFYDQNMQ